MHMYLMLCDCSVCSRLLDNEAESCISAQFVPLFDRPPRNSDDDTSSGSDAEEESSDWSQSTDNDDSFHQGEMSTAFLPHRQGDQDDNGQSWLSWCALL